MKEYETMRILDYPDWEVPTLFEELSPKAQFELTPELKKIDENLKSHVF